MEVERISSIGIYATKPVLCANEKTMCMKKSYWICLIFLCARTIFASITGDWHGALNPGFSEITLVLHIESDSSGTLIGKIDTLEYDLVNVPVTVIAFENEELRFLLKGQSFYQGILNSENTEIVGLFTQRGEQHQLVFKRGKKQFNRPQEPKRPYPYLEEEVRFYNQEIVLSGILTLPDTERRCPAMILIAGSGPNDRDETVFDHKPFFVLADYLTRKGIAVLRFDKRGVNHSTGSYETATSLDFASDVLAGIDYLKTRKEIGRIGLIGHSEGGLIAPIVAAKSLDVACIVLMAGTGVNGEEILYKQAELIQREDGVLEKDIQRDLSLRKNLVAILKNEADPVLVDSHLRIAIADYLLLSKNTPVSCIEFTHSNVDEICKWLNTPWVRFFLTYEPSVSLEQIAIPVLAINGALDVQVASSQNLPKIEQALRNAGNKQYKIQEFPGLNHLFQTCETGSIAEYKEIEETISPEVLHVIAEWVNGLFFSREIFYLGLEKID